MESYELLPSSPMPEIHPACDAYPPMSPDEFDEHKSDVRRRGQILPCEMYGEFLLDGRHRWRACADLGRTVKVQRFFGSEEDAIARVASLNGKRRNLTAGQKAAAAAALEPLFAATLAKSKAEKCADAGKLNEGVPKNLSSKTVEKVAQIIEQPSGRPRHDRAAELAAKATGANPQYVADVKKLQHTRPDLVDEIKAGKKTIPEAKREAKAAEPERAKSSERKSAPRNEKPKQDTNTLFGARVAWSAISRTKRVSLVAALKQVPDNLRQSFWVWAEQMTEDGQ